MCGISGIVSHALNAESRESLIQIMNRSIAHRGPDESSLKTVSYNCTLGMVRLKVIDFVGGQQPFFSSCKQNSNLYLIFNGEIYNHNDLRKILRSRGHIFKTSYSDTEVILHAYEEWGTESFSKLNGMFAFAIYDAYLSELIIVRDRFGEKPLYYQNENDVFYFCSELKGFNLGNKAKLEHDNYAFLEYLTLGFIGPSRTPFKSIKKLPASHYLVLSKDMKLSIHPYFTFDFSEKSFSDSEYQSEYINLLERSVERRMFADVPVGVFLSGGLDSSTIAYYAKKLNPDVHSFSIGFSEREYNEANEAKFVAEFLGLNHKSRVVTQKDAIDFLSVLPNVMDEPMADVSIIPTYYLSQLAKQNVTVALGGDGSDEFSFGYEVFNILRNLQKFERFHPFISIISDIADDFSLNSKTLRRIRKAKLLLDISNPQVRTNILTGYNYPYLNKLVKSEIYESFRDLFFENALVQIDIEPEKLWVLGYMNGYLGEDILVKIDRASMASSLEVRSPFLDHDLVNFLIKVPMKNNHRNGVGKQLLRKSMEGKLPPRTLRRKKQGFGIPVDEWFSGKFGHICKEIVLDSKINFPGLSKKAVKSLFDEHDHHREHLRHGHILWTLTTLHAWGQKWY